MNAEQILLDWLFPILDPLSQYSIPNYLMQPVYIHHEAVSKFTHAVTTLTEPGAQIFEGDAANAFVAKTEQYLHSEMLFTGAGSGNYSGAMVEAARACAFLVEEVTFAAAKADAELIGDDIVFEELEPILDAMAVSVVAQGFVDIPDNVATAIVAGVIGVVEGWRLISTLKDFFTAVYEAIQKWQRQIQNIANQSLPALPPSPLSLTEPTPNLPRVFVPVSERLEEIQQNVEELMVIEETPVVRLEIEKG